MEAPARLTEDMVSDPISRRLPRRAWAIVLALVVLVACASSSGVRGPSTTLSLPALKLAVLDKVGGHLAYCDPDQYPVAVDAPVEAARARLPAMQADRPAFDAILQHLGLSADGQYSDEQILAISSLYKQIQAIELLRSDDAYRFDVRVPRPEAEAGTLRVTGTVTPAGSVRIERREPGPPIACPICLAAGVRIATPRGDVAIQDLAPGTPVWTTDRLGRRIAGVVLATGHMEAPPGHAVVRLQLADGRTVMASPGHPTADGRTVGDLRPGQRFDGTRVAGVLLVPYSGFTYDLLPSGSTGAYFANGILLDSTLEPADAG